PGAVGEPARLARAPCAAAAGTLVWWLPAGWPPAVQHALGIATFMVVAWILVALDHALTGLIGCYLFWALGVAPFPVAFGGFADTTAWFLFGAVLFGAMATKSGLAKRLAYLVMRAIGHSYPRLLLGL